MLCETPELWYMFGGGALRTFSVFFRRFLHLRFFIFPRVIFFRKRKTLLSVLFFRRIRNFEKYGFKEFSKSQIPQNMDLRKFRILRIPNNMALRNFIILKIPKTLTVTPCGPKTPELGVFTKQKRPIRAFKTPDCPGRPQTRNLSRLVLNLTLNGVGGYIFFRKPLPTTTVCIYIYIYVYIYIHIS
jgi:hypothetical protein